MFRRLRIFPLLLLLVAVAAATTGPADRTPTDPKAITAPNNPNARPIPIDDLLYTRTVWSPAWSPDGSEIVFSTNITGRPNIWKVNANGGWPIQLAQSDERQLNAIWSPDGKWIVFESDFGGNEKWDIFRVPSSGGEITNLTNTPDIAETGVLFSPDGSMLAFSYKPKTSSVYDLAVMDLSTKKVRKLTEEKSPNHLWQFQVWSPDGKYVYADRGNIGFTDSSVYRVEVATGKAEELTPHNGEVLYSVSSVSPDGRTLLITSNEKGGYQNVALLDVASRKLTPVTDTQWEAISADFSPDGRRITYMINADGRTSVFVQPVGGKPTRLNLPEGLSSTAGRPNAFAPKGDRLLISHQSSQRPADLWVYDFKTNSARQLTRSAIASLNPSMLPPSQIVHYKSFDGQVISAFLWMPFNIKRDGTNPAIVIPHGGPTGQTVDTLNRTVAALASRGYICIAPNPRGSTGYGMQFQKANYQDLGGGDLQDYVFARKFLIDTGYVDANKVGITGGSYGGFMTLMAIGKTPELWKAAVNIFGVLNWNTMLKNADPLLQQYVKALLGDPEQHKQIYEDTSPLKYIRNATAPLLVLQGDNDIRVPKSETEEVVRVLKEQGKTVDVKYYAHEGHGFAKRENQIDSIRRTVDWFDKYLKASPVQASAAGK